MSRKKIKVTALMGGMEALNGLVRCHFSSWATARRMAKFYAEVAEEAEAIARAADELNREFPERRGDEYARRAAIIEAGEVELEAVTLTEADFLSPSDIPSPADMYLLSGIVEFE